MSDKPRAIDKIRAAFAAQRRECVVPEWGLSLWFGPLTVGELEAVEGRKPKTAYERNLYLLVHGARDVDGKPVFDVGDIHHLKTEADLEVVSRVIEFMWGTTPPTPKAADEELAADPSLASA